MIQNTVKLVHSHETQNQLVVSFCSAPHFLAGSTPNVPTVGGPTVGGLGGFGFHKCYEGWSSPLAYINRDSDASSDACVGKEQWDEFISECFSGWEPSEAGSCWCQYQTNADGDIDLTADPWQANYKVMNACTLTF